MSVALIISSLALVFTLESRFYRLSSPFPRAALSKP